MRTPLEIKTDITGIELELEHVIKTMQRTAKARIAELEKELKEANQAAVMAARERIVAILTEHNLTVDAVLAGVRTRAPAAPPTVHYVGPEGQIWHGRGPHPKWIKGQDKKQFERPGAPPRP